MSTEMAEILIVEDSPTDLELAVEALRDAGVANRIQVARDGEEALQALASWHETGSRPTFILLDLKLPKKSGFEVLDTIRRDPETRSIPVVVMTSSRQDPDIQRAYDLGANSYIVKPVDFDQFSSVTRTVGLYWMLVNETPPG